nr:MAG TPA: hypothetical protein [Caudoviricetes sp.]
MSISWSKKKLNIEIVEKDVETCRLNVFVTQEIS